MNDFYDDPLYVFRDLRRLFVLTVLASGKSTIQAVADQAQIPYSSVCRILGDLHDRGIVGRDELTDAHRPGDPRLEYWSAITQLELHAYPPGHLRVRATIGGHVWDSGWFRGEDR